MTPLALYQSYLDSQRIQSDPSQVEAITILDELYHAILTERKSLFRRKSLKKIKGVYLWGAVGRGKTFLMNLFYASLPFEQKIRLHFHRFMHTIHAELKLYSGESDPLAKIARAFSKRYDVLCFDEFHVSDIADAMILAELFKHLFHQGVIIVATSNIEPSGLYYNGLQRDKFLPTIDLIYKHMQVVHSLGEKDYRLHHLLTSKCYYFPLNDSAEVELSKVFDKLTANQNSHNEMITICDRKVPTIRCADTVVWFSFETLCETARSTEDYIEIAHYFDTLILSGIKQMDSQREASAKRFMHLIDELYERQVVLIASSEVNIDALYSGEWLAESFQRTRSRLIEMQSAEYISKAHLS